MSNLLKALEAADEADLATIDARIAESETALRRLKAARDILRQFLGLRSPATATTTSKPAAKAPSEQPADVIAALLRTSGPLTTPGIVAATGLKPQTVGIACARSKQIAQAPDGRWTLADSSAKSTTTNPLPASLSPDESKAMQVHSFLLTCPSGRKPATIAATLNMSVDEVRRILADETKFAATTDGYKALRGR